MVLWQWVFFTPAVWFPFCWKPITEPQHLPHWSSLVQTGPAVGAAAGILTITFK